MRSVFEEMGGTYRREGNYLLPNLEPPDTEHYQIGKYGHLRHTYLRERQPVLYSTLFLTGKLYQHLAEIDRICCEHMELLVRQMAEREGVTEALKASAQLEWVGCMNSIRNARRKLCWRRWSTNERV